MGEGEKNASASRSSKWQVCDDDDLVPSCESQQMHCKCCTVLQLCPIKNQGRLRSYQERVMVIYSPRTCPTQESMIYHWVCMLSRIYDIPNSKERKSDTTMLNQTSNKQSPEY